MQINKAPNLFECAAVTSFENVESEVEEKQKEEEVTVVVVVLVLVLFNLSFFEIDVDGQLV